MIEPSFIDDIDLDFCGDFFDHIDDLLNFPSGDVEEGVTGDCNGFQGACIDPLPDEVANSSSVLSCNDANSSSELPTELSIPHEDIAQLEWLSNFVEDSFSAGKIILDKDESNYNICNGNRNGSSKCDNKDSNHFRTSSPVSVLESSSSCSGGRTMLLNPETVIPGRPRSKRPRPATFKSRAVIPLISPTSSVTGPTPTQSDSVPEHENFAESSPSKKIMKPMKTEEKKRKKFSIPLLVGREQFDSLQEPVGVRKCMHCEITKTPQWRLGPMGPKTLCNACGVRYKSGRLFPEYRPAASPTFTACLHSNSHRKVLEMRTKTGPKMTAAQSVATRPPEFLPNHDYLDCM
ncbi:hypothetical protein IFM89_034796 [Coptis chinensis]|uniref:GATA transcription factor n=1 Tax=Coptis chinensis TaxID=261450 RepID=A0A835HAX1_9MAGN|nr:hypothetical protein IFM89_034796 [Coptis chinensis]